MAPLPIRQNHHPRTRLSNHACYFEAVLEGVLYPPVGNIESASPLNCKNLRRLGSLARAVVGRAARAHLALGQVETL